MPPGGGEVESRDARQALVRLKLDAPAMERDRRAMARVKSLLPDGFMLLLIGTVLLASLLPARGAVAGVVGIAATASVVLLFFLHGVRLSRQALLGGLVAWRLHLTIFAATFVLFPVLALGLRVVAGGLLPGPLWTGIVFLSVLPSTVQSSIAFTSIARGNVAGAVAAAAGSNLIGIALTPLLVTLLLRARGGDAISPGDVGRIVAELLLPFVVGHLLRPWLGAWAARRKALLVITDRGTILLAVYSAFSAAVVEGIWHRLDLATLAALLLVCALLLGLVLFATSSGARLLGFPREDRIAIVFCGSKKSMVSGIPMARVLFAGPGLGMIILPVMLFHQMQLMACAWLARRYADELSSIES